MKEADLVQRALEVFGALKSCDESENAHTCIYDPCGQHKQAIDVWMRIAKKAMKKRLSTN